MDIYNLNGKAKIWWQDLKLVKGLKWKNIEWKDFKKQYMFESYFEKKDKRVL